MRRETHIFQQGTAKSQPAVEVAPAGQHRALRGKEERMKTSACNLHHFSDSQIFQRLSQNGGKGSLLVHDCDRGRGSFLKEVNERHLRIRLVRLITGVQPVLPVNDFMQGEAKLAGAAVSHSPCGPAAAPTVEDGVTFS